MNCSGEDSSLSQRCFFEKFFKTLPIRDPDIQLTRKRLGIDIEVTVEATKLFSPIKSALEGRITFAEPANDDE